MRSNQTVVRFLSLSFALSLAATACTGKREAAFPDGEGQNLVPISEILGSTVTIKTGSAELLLGKGKVTEEKRFALPTVTVVSVEAPAFSLPMFKDLKIRALPDTTYTVRFTLDPIKGLGAHRVSSSETDLSELDQLISRTNQRGELLVPIFFFKLKDYGQVVRKKNDLGEVTDRLRLDNTQWKDATHVEFSTLAADRIQPNLPEAEGRTLFRKSLVQNLNVKLQTGKVQGSSAKVAIARAEAPRALQFMFFNPIQSLPSDQEVELVLSVMEREVRPVVRAFRVVQDTKSLTALEQASLLPKRNETESRLLPVFEFPIARGVKVEFKKDTEGRELPELQTTSVDVHEGNLIEVSTLVSSQKTIGLLSEQRRELFEKSKLDQAVMSKKQILDELGVKLAGAEEAPSTPMGLRLNGRQLAIFSVAEATAEHLKRLGRDERVMRCTAEIRKQLPAIKECLMIEQYRVELDFVGIEYAEDHKGQLTGEMRIRSGLAARDTELVQIRRGAVPIETGEERDPQSLIHLAHVRDSEFLMRRTMQDSPNGFDYTFAGAMGNLEIVRFVPEKDGVRILRADALKKVGGASDVDKETLMFIPATYYTREMTDAQGNPVALPRYVKTHHENKAANVVAFLDWRANRVPRVSSPLNYYDLSSMCFSGASASEVLHVDQRLGTPEGVLSFTLSTTLVANPSFDCVGLYSGDYFATVQASFTLDERISFKQHVRTSDEEKPLLAIPYLAQKTLGLGLFTYSKSNPTAGGTTGTVDTEIPLPAVFDVRNGKKITYILSGIPKSGPEREAIIQATEEVVADWNVAFKRAFDGTPMQRSGNVLELKVEGRDITAEQAGMLGDLDKNHIYYVQKVLNSGVLGIGGSSHNPRSGRVENGSVYLYGGNLKTSVEWLRKTEAARKQYQEIMDIVRPVKATDAPAAPETSEAGDAGVAGALGEKPELLVGTLPGSKPEALTPVRARLRKGTDVVRGLENWKSAHAHRATLSLRGKEEQAASFSALNPLQKSVYKAMQKGIETGAIRDAHEMEKLVYQSQLTEMARVLNPQDRAMLSRLAARSEAISKLKAAMSKNGLCVYERQEAGASMRDISQKSDLELLVTMYKSTLAHELGHNLGLRHNFIASFDKRNWKHEGEGETVRDYSSVMDYLERDDHYDGLGPQDVYAIRVAYTGLLELDANSQKLIKERNIREIPVAGGRRRIRLVSGKFLAAEDYRTLLGLTNWHELVTQPERMSQLPIRPKSYSFCSDEDANFTPICARFDRGTTPSEIVENLADRYKATYAIRNFPDDRITFSNWGLGSYIGRLISTYLPMRQFLEETFFVYSDLVKAGVEPEVTHQIVGGYARGVLTAMQFFHEIARTPDAPDAARDLQRFELIDVRLEGEGGKSLQAQIPIERKWLQDAGDPTRLRVRGVEFDKAFAVLMLTERGFGFERYWNSGLRLSFVDFEEIFGVGSEIEGGGFTLNLLKGIIEDQLLPMGRNSKIGLVPLRSPVFRASATEFMRAWALQGAVVSLDIDSPTLEGNPASRFHVYSSTQVPENVVSVGFPDGTSAHRRLWAHESSPIAHAIVGRIQLLDQVNAVGKELKPLIREWAGLKLGVEILPEEPKTPAEGEEPKTPRKYTPEEIATRLPEVQAKLEAALAKLPEGAGPTKLADAEGFMMQVLQMGVNLQNAAEAPSRLSLNRIETQLENLIHVAPVRGALLDPLPMKELGLSRIDSSIPRGTVKSGRDSRFRNLQLMNQLIAITQGEQFAAGR